MISVDISMGHLWSCPRGLRFSWKQFQTSEQTLHWGENVEVCLQLVCCCVTPTPKCLLLESSLG